MESGHPTSRLAFALQLLAEQDFRDTVIDILANNPAIGEKIKELHKNAADVRQDRPSPHVARVVTGLESTERGLALLSSFRRVGPATSLASQGVRSTDMKENQAIDGMMTWLGDQLVPNDVNSDKLTAQNLMLFRAVAKWMFWRSLLSGYTQRLRFCSTLSSGLKVVTPMKEDLPKLLDIAKRWMTLALAALHVSGDVDALVSASTRRKRGSRGGKGRQRGQDSTGPVVRTLVAEGPEVDIIASTITLDTIAETKAVVGVDPQVEISFSLHGPRAHVCLDTGCSITTVTRDFLLHMDPGAHIKALPRPWLTSGVIVNACTLKEHFARIDIYIDAKIGDAPFKVRIPHEVMIVDRFACGMLLGMDVIKKHQMVIDATQDKLIVNSCRGAEVQLAVGVYQQSQVVEDAKEEKRRMRKLRKAAGEDPWL